MSYDAINAELGGGGGSGNQNQNNNQNNTQLNSVIFHSNFSLKDFLVEKLSNYVDLTKYTIEAYDEQLESYENSKNNAIILIVKALSGISYNDKLSVPYQVLVYTPEIQQEQDEDPIKMVMDALNQLSNAFNGKPQTIDLSYITLTFQTPTMLNPLIEENILMRALLYLPVFVNESYDFGFVDKLIIDDQEVKFNNLTITDVTVDSTTTNSASNKQDSVSKGKTNQILIILNCDIKLNSFFYKLRGIRQRSNDINTLFKIEIAWNDGMTETYNVISSQAQVIVDRINNNNFLQVSMIGSE